MRDLDAPNCSNLQTWAPERLHNHCRCSRMLYTCLRHLSGYRRWLVDSCRRVYRLTVKRYDSVKRYDRVNQAVRLFFAESKVTECKKTSRNGAHDSYRYRLAHSRLVRHLECLRYLVLASYRLTLASYRLTSNGTITALNRYGYFSTQSEGIE